MPPCGHGTTMIAGLSEQVQAHVRMSGCFQCLPRLPSYDLQYDLHYDLLQMLQVERQLN